MIRSTSPTPVAYGELAANRIGSYKIREINGTLLIQCVQNVGSRDSCVLIEMTSSYAIDVNEDCVRNSITMISILLLL